MIVKLTFSTHYADLQPVFTTCGVLLLDKRNHVKVDSKVGMVIVEAGSTNLVFCSLKEKSATGGCSPHMQLSLILSSVARPPFEVLARTTPSP